MDFEMDINCVINVMEINLGPLCLDLKTLVIQDVVFGIGQKDPGIYLMNQSGPQVKHT